MATITLKNIPEGLYGKLKESASDHHRSINSEVIHLLESALLPQEISSEERIRRVRALRPKIEPATAEQIMALIEEGRRL